MKQETIPAAEALTRALLEFRKQGGRHHNPQELGRAEGHVLMFLSGLKPEDPGLRISDLSKELELSLSTLTQTTASLFRLGYVLRRADPKDRRVVRISLTPLGRSEVLNYLKDFSGYCARMAEFLGEKDSLVFARLLGKISGFMEAEPRQNRENLYAKEKQKSKGEKG
jgi:DNA-binding MarR family transcriptional regulator